MDTTTRTHTSDRSRPTEVRRTHRRFHKHGTKAWKGRRTPLRPCGAPGDEVWEEQGAGE